MFLKTIFTTVIFFTCPDIIIWLTLHIYYITYRSEHGKQSFYAELQLQYLEL